MFPKSSDWQQMQIYFEAFETISQAFFDGLEAEKVAKLDAHLKPQALSTKGLNFSQLIEQIKSEVVPQLSAARGPRYWGFVTGGATPVATFADWLVASFDQNVHKAGDSVASLIELQTIEWLCELFDLPKTFQGLITTGATGSNFLAACVARQFVGHQQGIDVAKEGVYQLDVEIFSTTPHASMLKSLGMAGLGQRHYRPVKALAGSEAMDVKDLEKHLAASSAKGKIVIASAATVTTTDFDDLQSLAKLCKKQAAWLHVDAAFGLFERLISGSQGQTQGIELADSITLDCHKWLNVPYDAGVFLTRHLDLLKQSFDLPAPYLANPSEQPDFMSLGVENSRRFRAFPIWLSLLAYGKEGVTKWVESNILLSRQLADWIEASSDYELVYPCRLNVVLFRPNCQGLSEAEANQLTDDRLEAINRDGRIFVSPGRWQGKSIIRIALSNWQTSEKDIQIAIERLTQLTGQKP